MSVAKQTALLKLKDALELLEERGERCSVVFAPDIARDTVLAEPQGKDLALELAGRPKDRLHGFELHVQGGGHAYLATNAATALRGTGPVDVAILAKVFPKDHGEMVGTYLGTRQAEMGVTPPDTTLVLREEESNDTMVNVILVRRGRHTIITGRQPKLAMKDYDGQQQKRLHGLLEEAEVVGMLSLKYQFTLDLIERMERGELKLKHWFCDATSSDQMDANYAVLDVLRRKLPGGSSPFSLVSINEHEAILHEMLLRRESEREALIDASNRKQELVKRLDALDARELSERQRIVKELEEIEAFCSKGSMENAFEAAQKVFEITGVPMLVHTHEGSCIIGGENATRFVPSVDVDFTGCSNFVGAGDTLCGAMATAMAVKAKTDALLAPENRLAYEDCLLIANMATCYRLAKINKVGMSDSAEWREAVGKLGEIYEWAEAQRFKQTAKIPGDIPFVDVEAKSTEYAQASCLNECQLVRGIRRFAEKGDTQIARVAFEELRNRKTQESTRALRIVALNPVAGKKFSQKAILELARRGGDGFAEIAVAAKAVEEKTARVIAPVLIENKDPRAADAFAAIAIEGRLNDWLSKLFYAIEQRNQKFGLKLYSPIASALDRGVLSKQQAELFFEKLKPRVDRAWAAKILMRLLMHPGLVECLGEKLRELGRENEEIEKRRGQLTRVMSSGTRTREERESEFEYPVISDWFNGVIPKLRVAATNEFKRMDATREEADELGSRILAGIRCRLVEILDATRMEISDDEYKQEALAQAEGLRDALEPAATVPKEKLDAVLTYLLYLNLVETGDLEAREDFGRNAGGAALLRRYEVEKLCLASMIRAPCSKRVEMALKKYVVTEMMHTYANDIRTRLEADALRRIAGQVEPLESNAATRLLVGKLLNVRKRRDTELFEMRYLRETLLPTYTGRQHRNPDRAKINVWKRIRNRGTGRAMATKNAAKARA